MNIELEVESELESEPNFKVCVALFIRKRMGDMVEIKEYANEVETYINHIDQLYIYNMTDQNIGEFYDLIKRHPNISYTECNDYGEVQNYQMAYEEFCKVDTTFGVVLEQGYYYEEDAFLYIKRYLMTNDYQKIAVMSPYPLRGCELFLKQSEDVRPCMGCNLVGTFVNMTLFKELSPLKLEYYQTTFDYEYCLRARQKGYQIMLAQNSVLRNNNYRILEKRVFFIKVSTFDYDLMDLYYQTRNRFYLWDEYEKIDPKYVKLDKKLYRGERHMMKVRDKNYRDKFYMMEEARYDYLRGIKGKYKGGNRK